MAWTTCSGCGASYSDDEGLRECPRCKLPIANATTEPTNPLAPGNSAPTTRPVSQRIIAAGTVFRVAILCSLLVFCVLGISVQPRTFDLGVPVQDEPWFWPSVGAGVGLLFGLLIATIVVLASPRIVTQEPVHIALTPESLPGFLTQMGYEFEGRKPPGGDFECLMTLTRDVWKVMISVNISPNRANLWMTMALGEIPASVDQHATRFLRLLQGSWETAPAFFACHRMSNVLCLMRSIENRNVTPLLFRQALDGLISEARRMAAWWDIAGWNRPGGWQPTTRSAANTESRDITPGGREFHEQK